MKRRSLLQAAAAALPAGGWLRAQQPVVPPKPTPVAEEAIPVIESAIPDIAASTVASFFSPEQFAALQRLSELIAPALDGVPGAREVGAAEFLDFLIGESPADRQELYRTGLDELNQRAKQQFDTTFAQLTEAQADRVLAPLRTPWSLKPDPFTGTKYFGGEARYIPHLEWGKPGEYLADRLTTEALNIMSKAREQPFYLNLWFHSVHVPAEAPETLVASYKQKLHPGLHHTNATYAAMVGNLDSNIGRVLDHIEKLGITDRTIVVFGSDNGGYIGKWQGARVTDNYPLRSGKGSLYEGGIRVPLMVRWPGKGAQGKSSEEPVISNDFYPTILDMAGLRGDASYERTDSRSLVALLKDPHGRVDRERLFFHYPHYYETTTPVSAVRERNWKLLQYLEDGHCELYDLSNDLSERNDLASRQPEKVVQMREQLESWRKAVNAQMPSRNPKVAFTDQQHRWDKADQELARMD